MLEPTFTAGLNVAMKIPLQHYEATVALPAEFRERTPTAGRVVGKEYVRAMVAFLTNDVAAVRARHRLRSPRRTLSTADEPPDSVTRTFCATPVSSRHVQGGHASPRPGAREYPANRLAEAPPLRSRYGCRGGTRHVG